MSWKWLATMPSTNARIAASIIAMIGTATRVIGSDWTPPLEWLGFLTVWGGLDLAQFANKRATSSEYVAAKQGIPPPDPPTPPEVGA